jgi:AcrR family transcriptional regulator
MSSRFTVIEPVGSSDPRIQRTRDLLHQALGSLIREKAYDRITVADILERAKVSRSTFYVHFRGKDDLLMSSMRSLLLGVLPKDGSPDTDAPGKMVAFSLPLLTHIHQHRRSARVRLGERGQALLHEHLRHVLSEWLLQTMEAPRQPRRSERYPVVPQLLARHIASTFVLILHWWLDQGAPTPPAEADKLFRALVVPILHSAQP